MWNTIELFYVFAAMGYINDYRSRMPCLVITTGSPANPASCRLFMFIASDCMHMECIVLCPMLYWWLESWRRQSCEWKRWKDGNGTCTQPEEDSKLGWYTWWSLLCSWCKYEVCRNSLSASMQQLHYNYRACVVPRTQNSFGDRAFSVAGPEIWNNLPPELRHVDISFRQFRNMLKSYLFRF